MLEDSAWKIKEDSELTIPNKHIKLDQIEDHFKGTGLVPIADTTGSNINHDIENPFEQDRQKHFYLYDPKRDDVPYSLLYYILPEDQSEAYRTYIDSIAMHHPSEKGSVPLWHSPELQSGETYFVPGDDIYFNQFDKNKPLQPEHTKSTEGTEQWEKDLERAKEIQQLYPTAGRRLLTWIRQNLPGPYGASFENKKLEQKARGLGLMANSNWKIADSKMYRQHTDGPPAAQTVVESAPDIHDPEDDEKIVDGKKWKMVRPKDNPQPNYYDKTPVGMKNSTPINFVIDKLKTRIANEYEQNALSVNQLGHQVHSLRGIIGKFLTGQIDYLIKDAFTLIDQTIINNNLDYLPAIKEKIQDIQTEISTLKEDAENDLLKNSSVIKEAPARSKAQYRYMQGICNGSIEPPEGMTRAKACEYVKNQDNYKELPEKASVWKTAKPNLVPPEAVRSAARRGIKYHAEGKAGDGFQDATLDRAHKIANGEELTPEHVRRMHSFFERHAGGRSKDAGDKVTPWDVAWLAWGGNAGRAWARQKDAELDRWEKGQKKNSKDCGCWDGYCRVPGTTPCEPGSCEKCDAARKESKWKFSKEQIWEIVLHGTEGYDIIGTGSFEECRKKTEEWLKDFIGGYINYNTEDDAYPIPKDAREQDKIALEELKKAEDTGRWSFYFDYDKPFDLIIQPFEKKKESKWKISAREPYKPVIKPNLSPLEPGQKLTIPEWWARHWEWRQLDRAYKQRQKEYKQERKQKEKQQAQKQQQQVQDLMSGKQSKWKIADYQGWTNWETWNTNLMMQNEYDSYKHFHNLVATGASLNQFIADAIGLVVGPYNQQLQKDFSEINDDEEVEMKKQHQKEEWWTKAEQAHPDDYLAQEEFVRKMEELTYSFLGEPEPTDIANHWLDESKINWQEIYNSWKGNAEAEGNQVMSKWKRVSATPFVMQVLEMHDKGYSTDQIAKAFSTSPKEVSRIVNSDLRQRPYEKLDLHQQYEKALMHKDEQKSQEIENKIWEQAGYMNDMGEYDESVDRLKLIQEAIKRKDRAKEHELTKEFWAEHGLGDEYEQNVMNPKQPTQEELNAWMQEELNKIPKQ